MAIRNDLNGRRIQIPGHPIIFLVINGRKSLIPNQSTYENLFCNWQDLILDFDVSEIDDGDDLDNATRLVKSTETNSIYLLGETTKRHIGDPQILEQYGFDWGKVMPLSRDKLEQYEEASAIQLRH